MPIHHPFLQVLKCLLYQAQNERWKIKKKRKMSNTDIKTKLLVLPLKLVDTLEV